MWQRMTQRLRVVRSQRRWYLRNTAQLPQRRQTQRLSYLVSMPTMVIAIVGVLYLCLQSSTIRINELLTPPQQVLVVPTPVVREVIRTPQTAAQINPIAIAATNEATVAVTAQPITHIAIPAIQLDSPVVDVGWDSITDTDGNAILVWQVAQYAVGHHYTSANPGQPNNIVLSGHVGGYGKVFRNLDQLKPNDHIILTSGNRLFTYVVQQQIIVEELHASPSEQIANLSYIDTTPSEMLTLITCWPPTGVTRFSQRLIIRALPQHTGNHK